MQALKKFAEGGEGGEKWHPVKGWEATEKSFTSN